MLSGQIVFRPQSTQTQEKPKTNGFHPQIEHKINQDAKTEVKKEHKKQDIKGKQKVEDLLDRSNKILLKVTTIFPFVLFPIDLVIDANKVDVVYRTFFFSEQIHSIFIKDITDVVVENAFWFGTLKIVDIGYTENSINIPWLWKEDAQKARRIIQGLVLAAKEGADLSPFQTQELAEKVESIGQVKSVSEDSN